MKKLAALFLGLMLCFAVMTCAGASEAVAMPDLTTNLWYANQVSYEGGVENHGQTGTWYYTQFDEDGTGYLHIESFVNPYPTSLNLTWKAVSDTEVELVIGEETIPMTYDGQFLSFTMSGLTFQLASRDTELGQAIYREAEDMSFSGEKDEDGRLEGVFKPVAVFFGTENGVGFVKCDDTIPAVHLLFVEKDWSEENRYVVRLIQTEESFNDVTTFEEAYAIIEDATRYSKYFSNWEVDVKDSALLENVTLEGDGEERVIQSFYPQQWKQSYILQMENMYFICMPLESALLIGF